jgi:hypothetical protein
MLWGTRAGASNQVYLSLGGSGNLQFYYEAGGNAAIASQNANGFSDGATGWKLLIVRADDSVGGPNGL